MQQMIDAQKGDDELFILDLFFKWYVNHSLKLWLLVLISRYQETDSKVYVIFFFWKAFVVVSDPSYTKVSKSIAMDVYYNVRTCLLGNYHASEEQQAKGSV